MRGVIAEIRGCYNEKNGCYNVLFCTKCTHAEECDYHRGAEELHLLYTLKIEEDRF